MIKAGVLFPRSTIFPLLGSDLIGGIRSFLRQHSLSDKTELVLEPIGFGGDSKEVFQKTEHLILIENVDIILAFIDQRVVDLIYPLVSAAGKTLVVINPGANYADNWVPPDNVIFLDLQDALLSRLSSIRFIDSGRKDAIFTASYYDGGYHHGHALITPFLNSGGTIRYNYISELRLTDFTTAPLQQFLKDSSVNCLLSVFSGDESNRFLEELEGSGRADLEIFASPQMLEEQTLGKLKGSISFSVHSYLPWHSAIGSSENTEFKAEVKNELKREASIFSLLGWEAAMLVKGYIEYGQGLVGHLKQNSLITPRGEMKMDELSQHLIGPAYEASFGKGKGLKIENIVSTDHCLKEWKQLMESAQVIESSGWTNTYLCY